MLRALYDWLVDSGDVPHLLVDAEFDGVQVPQQYVQDGRIVLNVGPDAVDDIVMGNEYIMFNARFGGKPMEVILPQESVIAIYGRDSGEGMMFNLDDVDLEAPESSEPTLSVADTPDAPEGDDSPDGDGPKGKSKGKSKGKRGKPDLKVIK